MTTNAISIRIFLPDGDPLGLKVLDIPHWDGSGLAFPRELLAIALFRPELDHAGVLIFAGPPGDHRVHVGSGAPLRDGIEGYAAAADRWVRAVAFTRRHEAFSRAQVRHLEVRLAERLAAAGADVTRGHATPDHPLGEAAAADAEVFVDRVAGASRCWAS